jgi:hypothetical protein
MKTFVRAMSLVLAAGWIWGCGSEVADGARVSAPGAKPQSTAMGGAAPAGVTTPMAAPPGAGGSATPPPAAQTNPSQTPGQPPANVDQVPPMGEAAPVATDSCMERRASRGKPCHNDPDPCKLDSGFLGDEYCLLPPSPEAGVQIHVGPTDYKDAAEVAKFSIEPNTEFLNSVLGHIPLTEERWWNHIEISMRPGSHHWIMSQVAGQPEARFYDDGQCGSAMSVGSLAGGQNLIVDSPPLGIPAPENVGMGSNIQPNASVCVNLHSYNFEATTQIREFWINLYYIDASEVTQTTGGIGMIGAFGLNLPPGQDQTLMYESAAPSDGRIIQIFGHRHAWTPRLAAWLNDELVYDSWDWQESVTFNYDSITTNPPINTEGKTDGAKSGPIPFKTGDLLKYACFIENRSDETLMFKNELKGGEMCNLWGRTVGGSFQGRFQ